MGWETKRSRNLLALGIVLLGCTTEPAGSAGSGGGAQDASGGSPGGLGGDTAATGGTHAAGGSSGGTATGGTDATGGSGGMATGGTDASGGADASGGGSAVPACSAFSGNPQPSDVADCKRETVAAARHCDGSRVCLHQFYEQLCESDRADVILSAYRCQDRTCRIFGDPNDADVCLRELHEAAGTERTQLLDERWCELCPSDSACPFTTDGDGYREFTSVMFDPARVECIITCLDTAADCDQAAACWLDGLPGAEAALGSGSCTAPIEYLPPRSDAADDYVAACETEIDLAGCSRCFPASRELCSAGNPEAVLGMVWCLAVGSCWSEWDHNTAGPCMDTVIDTFSDDSVEAVHAHLSGLGCTEREVRASTALAVQMNASDRTAYATCVEEIAAGGTACSSEAIDCLSVTAYDASLCSN